VTVYTDGDGKSVYEHRGTFHKSARSLLRAVTGKPNEQTSFDRYFHTGKFQTSEPAGNILVLLDESTSKVAVDGEISTPLKSQSIVVDSDDTLRLLVDEFMSELDETGMFSEPEVKLGIDLENRGHEVRKLLYAGFRGKMLSQGYDPDDVLQEVYKGLLTRNNGKCPWDGRKATFGYYVHMVINCVLTNYHRKQTRRQDRDYIEVGDAIGLSSGLAEPENAVADQMARTSLDDWLRLEGGDRREAGIAREILPMVTDGMARREIVARTGYAENVVAKALAWLRKETRAWAAHVGV
jgi:DNA-directed RNA polymerase specialized sigma24 family protein